MAKYLLSLHTLRQLGRHPRIHLHGRDMLRLLQYAHSEVARTRTNFKHLVRGAKVCLGVHEHCSQTASACIIRALLKH